MNRWWEKANQAWQGWVNATGGPPPNTNALRLFLAHAQHEDECGDDWDHYGGWGCCNLRSLTALERAAFAAGTLVVGDWLYPDGSWGSVHRPDSIGTIRGDSDPTSGPFHVWFAAFPNGAGGPTYMLKAGVRGARAALDDPQCSPATYAEALYVWVCYYGGIHPTKEERAEGWPEPRPCGKRTAPWNLSEQAAIDDYTKALLHNLPAVDAGLVGWLPPGPYGQPAPDPFVENTTPNAGGESGKATNVGTDDTEPPPPDPENPG